MELSHEDILIAQLFADPVLFAAYHFNWYPYPYQEEILRHPGKRKITRWGRRLGKTDTLAIKSIHYAYTHGRDPDDKDSEGGIVLIGAPYDSQVELIFNRIRELIDKSPEISGSKDRDVRNPHCITFKNGARIAGFTTGTKSGQQGASIRGQKADWVIVDEMDYMTGEDLIAIITIAADMTRDCGVWLSSTPSGKREKFWEFCVEAQGTTDEVPPGIYEGETWVESYYPSTCSPLWQKDPKKNEREWKMILGEDGYIREILAQFGPETVGVFNKSYIDRAKRDYVYSTKVRKGPLRVVGVDWDKVQATPTLMCLEWCPDEKNASGDSGMFKIVARESIPRTEFVLNAAVERIVQWNYIYDPEWIYVDRGCGEYQVERLHLLGLEAQKGEPAYGLDRKVIGVNFNQNRKVKDPGTGEMIPKPTNVWMINQTVELFNNDKIIISQHDDVVYKQLENYRVEKITQGGRPRFTSKNEHCVDALALCVLAIVDNYPELTEVVQKFAPTRTMAIAPPIKRPLLTIKRHSSNSDDDDEEEFISESVRANNSSTWIRVDDIRDVTRSRNLDSMAYNLYRGSPFAPRGAFQRRRTVRKSF